MRTQSLEIETVADGVVLAGLCRDRAKQIRSLALRMKEPFAREMLERTAIDMCDIADRFQDAGVEPAPLPNPLPISAVDEPLREGQMRLKFFAG